MHKNFTKRLLLLLAALILISCSSSIYAETRDSTVIDSGTCGENITWILDGEGVLTISGTGEMGAFDSAFRPYKVKKVIIEEGITSIVNEAFKGGYNITEVSIPNSVVYINYSAFEGCSSLTTSTIPDSVTSIGYYAFKGCSSLTTITIPDNVTSIEYCTFYGCSSLTSVIIPNGVKDIGASAFEGCGSLTSITIPDSVTSIGGSAFSGCSGLTSITIPDSVTSIGGSAFYGCSGLTSITIPDSVTSIGNYAFEGCSSLTTITIPDSVTSIGGGAFEGCSGLTSITIPDSVTSIGYRAFMGCGGLTSITIPDSVTSIGEYAFKGCSSLTTITIPDSVTSIGGYAFSGCSGLTSITIPDSVTSIGGYAFEGCSSLTTITIPDSVTSIGYSAFEGCSSLTSVIIPNGVTSIGDSAFKGCSSLTTITIPDSVTSIGYRAFMGCGGLTSITIPDSVTSIGGGAFADCSSLTTITIPDSVTSIGGYAFEGCSSLTTITIPDSVTSIGDSAFEFCSSLTTITIPDSVTSIGGYAFADCSSLTTITIPDSVTLIGNYAFSYCWSLTIYGEVNSYAHTYAKSNNINFQCLEHKNIVTVPAVEPSCSKPGLTAGEKCSDCGTFTTAQAVIPNTEHKYGEWIIDREATCTEEGSKHRICQNCKTRENSIIPKKGNNVFEKENVVRLQGSNRFGTSADISKGLIADGQAEAIVIVDGMGFPDALAATPFAASIGAPILMANGAVGQLDDSVISELNRIDPDHNAKIYLIGGTGAVSNTAVTKLKSMGYAASDIERIAGMSRFTTAIEVAKRVPTANTAYVAYGFNYPDALGGGSAAALNNGVILFTEYEMLTSETKEYLQNGNFNKVVILGGEGAVSGNVENELRGMFGGNVTRVAGRDRFLTSLEVAKSHFATTETITISTGMNFADALAGGPLASALGAPILLVDGEENSVPQEMIDYIKASGARNVVVLGGTGAVSEGIRTQIANAVNNKSC